MLCFSEKTAVSEVYVCALLDQEVAGSNPVAPISCDSKPFDESIKGLPHWELFASLLRRSGALSDVSASHSFEFLLPAESLYGFCNHPMNERTACTCWRATACLKLCIGFPR